MTTEADQKPTLSELAEIMETAAANYDNAKRQLDSIAAHERNAFKISNDTRRAFNDAVNALKPKRPKKVTPATPEAAA